MKQVFFTQPLAKLFTTESDRDYKFYFFGLLAIITIIFIILINMGLAPVFALPWDPIILLDGGWRIVNGQTPNIDFYNPVGPLSILLTAFGMEVASPSASSITYGNLLIFLILIPCAWFIAHSRLSALNTFLFTVFMAFLLVAPRALGDYLNATSYAMIYNRHGFVIISIMLIELFIVPRTSVGKNKILLGGFLSGILAALLLFCKINYFGIAIIAVLLRVLFFPNSSKWFFAFSGGFFLTCIIMYALFKINILALTSDLSVAAKAQSKAKRLAELQRVFSRNFYYILLILITLILFTYNKLTKPKLEKTEFLQIGKIWILTIFVALSGWLICTTNAQTRDIPLFFVAGLIPLETMRREFKFFEQAKNKILEINYFVVILIVTSFCGIILIKDIVSFVYSVDTWRTFNAESIEKSQQFQSKSMSDFLIPESSITSLIAKPMAKDYPKEINDGLELLRRHLSKDSKILTMDLSNPFPFALQLPPPSGDPLWWDPHKSFNKYHFPDPERTFNDVNMIMIPKYERSNHIVKAIEEIYQNYLQKHFIEKDDSQFWTLLVKRP